jgi:hypothetical protein
MLSVPRVAKGLQSVLAETDAVYSITDDGVLNLMHLHYYVSLIRVFNLYVGGPNYYFHYSKFAVSVCHTTEVPTSVLQIYN